MQQRSFFSRWLTGCLLLSLLVVGILGGAGLSVRAAPDSKPFAACPDPIIAQWTFTGDVTIPATGTGVLSWGTGVNAPTFPGGKTTSDDPAISFTGWSNGDVVVNDEYLGFELDTTDKSSIQITFDYRLSNTGPNKFELRYSTTDQNDTSFITFGSPFSMTRDGKWYAQTIDLSSLADLNNKGKIYIRLYGYGDATTTTSGTWRMDNITFSGTCPASTRAVLISEIAWAGTSANTDHEWIELYNPGTVDINFNDGVNPPWTLESIDGKFKINLLGTIPAMGYFLLESNEDAVADILSDQIYTGNTLNNQGMQLVLYDNRVVHHTVVDTANLGGTEWPAGDISTFSTMERIGNMPDSDSSWFTNNGVMRNGVDALGNPIWGTPKGLNSLTPTPIPPTLTPTLTPSPTLTPTPVGALAVVINEVAWGGTQSSSEDEWIELYNPSTRPINLSGWKLASSDGSPDIPLTGTISAGGYFLLERTDDDTITDISADMIYTGSLSNTGEILRLFDPGNNLIDTANSNSYYWPAGNSYTYSSMERTLIRTDSDYVWVTYNPANDSLNSEDRATDASGYIIRGTPKRQNTQLNVTPTPTPRSSSSGGSSSGGYTSYIPPDPILGISEFLPRPGYDWNNDGVTDVFDEFIEIINAGSVDVNLGSYRLDDEQNLGSSMYTLPNITLKPGERAVFYASETGILLSDAGDTVRLLKGSSTVVDSYTYGVVRYPDQAWCRIPDRLGYWNKPCFPSPGNPNALTGTVPQPPKNETVFLVPACLLPDTTPDVFVYAECESSGDEIWNRQYWDSLDDTKKIEIAEPQKWETIFE